MTVIATRRQVLAGASATAALAPAMASAQAVSVRSGAAAEASKLARELFMGNISPALSVAVARGSGTIWGETLGKADLELDVPATTQHAFRLGSVCKVLTSTAAARLVSRGVLDLDAPISRWLPDLPEQHRATTLRQLLTHRGGVRHFQPKDFDLFGPGGAVYMRIYPTDRDVLALFINDPLVAPPGTRVAYSTYGYTLASMAMAAAAGIEFRKLIHREIGETFGLTSLADDDPWTIVPNRAAGYLSRPDIDLLYGGLPEGARPKLTEGFANIPTSNPAYSWAGAGFLLTPTDAARFGAAMLASPNRGINDAERDLLFTPMTKATPTSPPLGLGWRVDSDAKGRRRWHHAGATPGGRYVLVIYPDAGLSVAIAGNVMGMRLDVMKAASNLADIFQT
jgi:serine beta-lactamase-like protein LACTB